ncbi:hypothetical protein F5B22DRAFT_457192 [Xylaria bambusicola]|uniref:uncharacterized protein n=1 Tax=Xylaria bambusicola TaxID=326684 RepID=UPI002008D561|nr:uncharacterized protein F5B22DRAFT_457192 [Xylaria bambusicola]KAI0522052.1 hypothetical protein F5B22DRAFT_457192 [Xylaria bambusicola]
MGWLPIFGMGVPVGVASYYPDSTVVMAFCPQSWGIRSRCSADFWHICMSPKRIRKQWPISRDSWSDKESTGMFECFSAKLFRLVYWYAYKSMV